MLQGQFSMKNLNKSKIVGVAAVSLAAVSLIGVGFASWVISGITNPTVGEESVSVTVGEVIDNRATIEASMDPSNSTLCFDAKKTDKSGAIQHTGETAGEDLTFAIKVKTNKIESGNISVKAAIKNYDTCTLKTAIDSGYLTGPAISSNPTVTLTGTAQTVTTLTSTAEVTLTFSLGWGDKFGGYNPSEYEDHKGVVSDIVTNLKAFEKLGSLSFTVVLTAELASK